jgi:hypothetical protein
MLLSYAAAVGRTGHRGLTHHIPFHVAKISAAKCAEHVLQVVRAGNWWFQIDIRWGRMMTSPDAKIQRSSWRSRDQCDIIWRTARRTARLSNADGCTPTLIGDNNWRHRKQQRHNSGRKCCLGYTRTMPEPSARRRLTNAVPLLRQASHGCRSMLNVS